MLREGAQLSTDELMRHVARRLARYKRPRRLWFVDALPRTATGKVVKRRIVVPERTSPVAAPDLWV